SWVHRRGSSTSISNGHQGLEPVLPARVFGRLAVISPTLSWCSMPSLFVGIDVSLHTLDVRHLPADQAFRVPNTPDGHRQLVDTLRPLTPKSSGIRIVLESTGGLETPVAIALAEAGFEVAIIKPERARYFAKAHGQLAK